MGGGGKLSLGGGGIPGHPPPSMKPCPVLCGEVEGKKGEGGGGGKGEREGGGRESVSYSAIIAPVIS